VVQFVAPGFLGDLSDFKRTYSDPVMRGQGPNASEGEIARVRARTVTLLLLQHTIIMDCSYSALRCHTLSCFLRLLSSRYISFQGEMAAKRLQHKMSSILLRRTRETVLRVREDTHEHTTHTHTLIYTHTHIHFLSSFLFTFLSSFLFTFLSSFLFTFSPCISSLSSDPIYRRHNSLSTLALTLTPGRIAP
jgi:hypothetical protein